MTHQTDLIAAIAMGLTAAFVGGLIAHRLKLPSLVGYLLAGMAVGPFTPGFVANPQLAPQLAEIGVILLLFGVGIHFSLRDLLSVWRIAVPGAIVGVLIATLLGTGLALTWGWPWGHGLMLGLSISIGSTVVLLRSLSNRNLLDQRAGQVAIGWLIVEDLITILTLVMLPFLAGIMGGETSTHTGSGGPFANIALTLGKAMLFIVVMLVVGRRTIPWLLTRVQHTGSRELFLLAVLAAALGIAYAASEVFGVSFALGAFVAGIVVNESEVSHEAAEEALPLQDAFAVLFFVFVGMMIDPTFLLDEAPRILAIVAVVIAGKPLAAFAMVRILGGTTHTGLIVASGLAQIGEFSFILVELGLGLKLLPEDGRSLILAAALVLITLNPLLVGGAARLSDRLQAEAAPLDAERVAVAEGRREQGPEPDAAVAR